VWVRVCSCLFFFFSSRRRHTRCYRDWSSDVCSSDLAGGAVERDLAILVAFAVDRHVPAAAAKMHMLALEAAQLLSAQACVQRDRSEERRVGKECRALWRLRV